MYKKIISLMLVFCFYCYSSESSVASENATQVTRLEFPPAFLNLTKDAQEAYLNSLKKTTTVAGKFTNTLRQIVQEDSKAATDRLEKSVESIAETISKKTTSTVIDVTRALGLQALFAWSVYYGCTIIKNDLLMGFFWITFGVIGLIHVQNILENIQKFSDSPTKYINANFNKKQLKRFISKLMRKAMKNETNLDMFEDYIASHQITLIGSQKPIRDDNNLVILGNKLLIKRSLKNSAQSQEAAKCPINESQQNQARALDRDQVLNNALDQFDAGVAPQREQHDNPLED